MAAQRQIAVHPAVLKVFKREDLQHIPVADEQYRLIAAYKKGDRDAGLRLIGAHMLLAMKLARGKLGAQFLQEYADDCVHIAIVAMFEVLDKWDSEKAQGALFSTYASWWLAEAFTEVLQTIGTPFDIPRGNDMRKLRNAYIAKSKIGTGVHQIVQELEEEFPDKKEKIALLAMQYGNYNLVNINREITRSGGSEKTVSFEEVIADPHAINPENSALDEVELSERRSLLKDALGLLTSREQKIFVDRRLRESCPETTLEYLGRIFGISKERVRQIEVRAFQKVREYMLSGEIPKSRERAPLVMV